MSSTFVPEEAKLESLSRKTKLSDDPAFTHAIHRLRRCRENNLTDETLVVEPSFRSSGAAATLSLKKKKEPSLTLREERIWAQWGNLEAAHQL